MPLNDLPSIRYLGRSRHAACLWCVSQGAPLWSQNFRVGTFFLLALLVQAEQVAALSMLFKLVCQACFVMVLILKSGSISMQKCVEKRDECGKLPVKNLAETGE